MVCAVKAPDAGTNSTLVAVCGPSTQSDAAMKMAVITFIGALLDPALADTFAIEFNAQKKRSKSQ
jgi:hypothetical protein